MNVGDVFTVAGVFAVHSETKISTGVLQQFVVTAAFAGGGSASLPALAWPAPGALRDLRAMLLAARRPLVIAGGSGWDAEAANALQRFAENWQLPVGCGFRFQDTFDNRHPLYAGDVGIGINPKLAARIRDADLVLAVGVRLGEMTTGGYTLLQAPLPPTALTTAATASPPPSR